MLNRYARAFFTKLLTPVAAVLIRLGISPDVVTIIGTLGVCFGALAFYPRGEFLASIDERFRPVYLSSAPDGTLYIADLYRGIIEHRISITEYLRVARENGALRCVVDLSACVSLPTTIVGPTRSSGTGTAPSCTWPTGESACSRRAVST